jgi:DNA-directed RNA polymerase specialized sigma24 family protein
LTPIPAETCTDAERLAEYADGRLRQPDCDEVEAHLDVCSPCREVLTAVAAFAQREREQLAHPAPDLLRYERAIASLAPREQAVFLARYESIRSFEEIAGAMAMTTADVRAVFATTVMKLRLVLARQ